MPRSSLFVPVSALSERAVRRIAASRVWEEQNGEPCVPCVDYPALGSKMLEVLVRKVVARDFFRQEAGKEPAKDEAFWGQFSAKPTAEGQSLPSRREVAGSDTSFPLA